MKPKLFRVVIAITIFLAVFVFCTVYFRSNIVPTVMDSSVAQMRAVTTNAVNLAATSVLSDGLTYEMLFDIVKDKDGNISMIKANSPQINKIARQIANLAQANLDSCAPYGIRPRRNHKNHADRYGKLRFRILFPIGRDKSDIAQNLHRRICGREHRHADRSTHHSGQSRSSGVRKSHRRQNSANLSEFVRFVEFTQFKHLVFTFKFSSSASAKSIRKQIRTR